MPIFNPPNSNRNVELIEFAMAYVSGTAASGGILVMGVPLTAVATGQPVTVWLTTSPTNQLLGAGNTSRTISSNSNAASSLTVTAGTTLPPSSTAPGVIRTLASINAQTTATPTGSILTAYQFNGTMIIPQGFFIYFAASVATTALYCMSLTWKEIPIVPAQG